MRRFVNWFVGLGMISAIFTLSIGCGDPASTNLSPASTSQADNTNSSSSPTFYLRITDNNLAKLKNFESHRSEAYDPVSPSGTLLSKLRWDKYGENLEVNLSKNGKSSPTADGYTQFDYSWGNPDYWGECVSAVRALSGNGSEYPTSAWEKGPRVMGAMDESVTAGTVIATFSDNKGTKFLSGTDHTAIFKDKSNNGIEVWDQNWQFLGVFGTHNINASDNASGTSNANNYYVVQVNNASQTAKTATPTISSAPLPPGINIQYEQEVTGTIAYSGDYKDWKFNGQAGDIITIHMVENGGASLSPQVYLFDPSGSKVIEAYDYSTAWINHYTLRFSGTYTIRATGMHSSTGGYKLSLALKPPGSIVYGQEVTGQIEFGGDYQDWKFNGQAGDIITIHMVENGGASLSPQVYLFDPSGSEVIEAYDYSTAWINHYTLRFSRTYTIRATGMHSSTGGYRLSLNKN